MPVKPSQQLPPNEEKQYDDWASVLVDVSVFSSKPPAKRWVRGRVTDQTQIRTAAGQTAWVYRVEVDDDGYDAYFDTWYGAGELKPYEGADAKAQ